MKIALALLGISMGFLKAETVLWKAAGSITSTSGDFLNPSLPQDGPVSIRMTYDDRAEEVILKNVFGDVESDFRTAIDLTLTIEIGPFVWKGTTFSGSSSLPHTFFTKLRSFSATPESLTATVDSRDNGTFSSFPLGTIGETLSSEVSFLGPNTFLGVGIESLEIDPSAITTSMGSLKSGTSQLQFNIDPTSVRVLDLAQEPVSPVLTISTPENQFQINWRSSPSFTYRIERSQTLNGSSWNVLETINGTGATFSRQYPRNARPEFYRIVTDVKTP